MSKIVFLGTGSAGGVMGQGRSRRNESSLLIKSRATILIDVTHNFNEQSRALSSPPDAILITHGHSDAIGGMAQLRNWLQKKSCQIIKCYAHPTTIKIIKRRFKITDFLEFIPIKSNQTFSLKQGIKIQPFSVRHSMQKGFPTFGFKIWLGSKQISYVSDTGECGQRLKNNVKKSDILIIDGALWNRHMPAHLDMKQATPKICQWPIKKIIFTQIGKSAPRHEILSKELKKMCHRALPAYDGLKLNV